MAIYLHSSMTHSFYCDFSERTQSIFGLLLVIVRSSRYSESLNDRQIQLRHTKISFMCNSNW